jgi:hypothetical protein
LRNLLFNILLILLLSGCSASLFNNYRVYDMQAAPDENSCSWFREDTGRYLFQSSIDIYKNNFSGLLFVKPLNESHRILFITELGIKIFDMEFFRKGDFRIHYCLDEMNRKSITNTLGNDLSLMIYNIADNGTAEVMQERNEGRLAIKSEDGRGTRYCLINKKTGKIDELIKTGTFAKKLNIKFFSTAGTAPDSIVFTHYNLKLNIHLTRLDETGTIISE